MSQVSTQGPVPLAASTIQLPNFVISFVGENPYEKGFCFGSEDGKLWLTRIDSAVPGVTAQNVVESGEAINGVAFWRNFLAVSTRCEVILGNLNAPEEVQSMYEGGAHDVTVTPSGCFVAPLGPDGLLLFRAAMTREEQGFRIVRTPARLFNFYKATALGQTNYGELVACAARGDGATVTILGDEHSPNRLRAIGYPGVDIVDVCPVGHNGKSPAFAALGKDCSIHFVRDALQDRHPYSLPFPGLGTGYRIFSGLGHIIVLTSNWACLFLDLATRFLSGENPGGRIRCRMTPVEAIDGCLAYERWLAIILADKAIAIDIAKLAGGESTLEKSLAPQAIKHEWAADELVLTPGA